MTTRVFTAPELEALGVHPATAVSFEAVPVRPQQGETYLPPDLFLHDLVFEADGRFWTMRYRYPHIGCGPYPPEVVAVEVAMRPVVVDRWLPVE